MYLELQLIKRFMVQTILMKGDKGCDGVCNVKVFKFRNVVNGGTNQVYQCYRNGFMDYMIFFSKSHISEINFLLTYGFA